MDTKLAKSDLNTLRVFVLESKFGSLTRSEEYVFLDNLYLSETSLKDPKKLALFIKNEFLDLDRLSQAYTQQLDSELKFVNINFVGFCGGVYKN